MNDNINFKLKVWKNGHENLKIQRLLLNIQIRCRISMKVLKIIKVIIVLDGIIGAIISNKKLNQRVTLNYLLDEEN